jgi:hypothetical protein
MYASLQLPLSVFAFTLIRQKKLWSGTQLYVGRNCTAVPPAVPPHHNVAQRALAELYISAVFSIQFSLRLTVLYIAPSITCRVIVPASGLKLEKWERLACGYFSSQVKLCFRLSATNSVSLHMAREVFTDLLTCSCKVPTDEATTT